VMNNFIFLISGLALPILLWPIEFILPYPHIIEELAKYLSLLLLKKNQSKKDWSKNKTNFKLALLFGLFFTLSESVLYMMNFFILWQIDLLPIRLLLTGLLHITTVLILFASLNKKVIWQITALLIVICIHYIYNYSVTAIF
jgi:hypothetical protein